VLGGALSYAAGWEWIFWFLTIVASLCLALVAIFLPETSRNIVGNGSARPARRLCRPLWKIMCHWKDGDDEPPRGGGRIPNPLRSVKILLRKDNAVVILACGLMYAVYTCVTATLATLFVETYGVNEWQAGLIYLPFGLGGTCSTFFSGRLMDRSYRKARAERGLPTDKARGDDLDNFPIEKARLAVMWWPMGVTVVSVVAYGWVVHFKQVG